MIWQRLVPSNLVIPPEPSYDAIALRLRNYRIDVSDHVSLGDFIELIAYISMMAGFGIANDPSVNEVEPAFD